MEFVGWLKDHMISCPMKAATGIDCPGCGLQRAVIKLLEGDIEGSIQMHPAAIPMLFMIIFLLIHLKVDLKHGARILTIVFIFSTILTLINYIRKWMTGEVFS
jgi:hypothetical protein